MMNFRKIKTNVITILGDAAAGRFVTVGYQQQKTSAKEAKGNNRIVRVYYRVGDFPKEKGSLNGPVMHDMDFAIELTASASAKADVATLNNEASTPAQKAAALVGLKEASEEADKSIDELWEIVYQILMDARNIFLGDDPEVANRWIPNFRKDDTLDDGELVVITGNASLTCSIDEQVTGDTPVEGDKVFTTTLQSNYDDAGVPIDDAGVIVDQNPTNPNILFLLQGNGTNGSSDIIDSSQYARAITPQNGAVITTAFKKWGVGSVDLTAGKRLITPIGTWADFGTGDFTFATWLYPLSRTGFGGLLSSDAVTEDWAWVMQFVGIEANQYFKDAAAGGFASSQYSYPLNQWNHIAVRRTSGTLEYFFNNVLVGSGAYTANIIAGDIEPGSNIEIGTRNGLGQNPIDAYIDDLIIASESLDINALYTGEASP